MSASSARTPELGRWSASVETGEPFGDWELPGMGEAAPNCGEVSAVSFCDAAGHIEFRAHQCGRRECPECWSNQWAAQRTVNVAARLAAARYAAEAAADKRGIHAVVSPEGETIDTIAAFYAARRRANEIAKEHGIRGGVIIAHGYRATDETRDRYESSGSDLPLWWWIRENGRPWREQVEWSPHFHIIGLASSENRDPESGRPGHIEPGEDRPDGWVFKNIRSLDRYEGTRDRGGMEDMVGLTRYLLSHTTYPAGEDRQAVTWFGELHGTNFNPEEALEPREWDRVQRVAKRAVGKEVDLEDGEGGAEECSVEGCDGNVHEIWEARAFLDTVGGSISAEMYDRIDTAYRWAIGDLEPPPELQRPRSVSWAEEAFAELLESAPEERSPRERIVRAARVRDGATLGELAKAADVPRERVKKLRVDGTLFEHGDGQLRVT